MKQKNIDLKALILNPGKTDKFGLSRLDRYADNLRVGTPEEKKSVESELSSIIETLGEFNASDIVRLFGFSKRSELNLLKIAETCSKQLQIEKTDLNTFQRLELARFVLQIAPESITITQLSNLSSLKTTHPWKYAELLAIKTPNDVLDFVLFIINRDKNHNTSSLVSLILKWKKIGNPNILNRLTSELLPLVKSDKKVANFLEEMVKKGNDAQKKTQERSFITGSTEYQEFKKGVQMAN